MTSVYHAAPHLCGEHLMVFFFPKDRLVGNNIMVALRMQRQYNKWYFLQPLTQTDSLQYIIFVLGCVSVCVFVRALPPCCAASASAAIASRERARSYLSLPSESDPGHGQSTSSRLLPETALWRLGERLTKRWRETGLVRAGVLREGKISLPMEDRPRAQGGGE